MGRRARKKNQKRIEEVRRNYISHDEWGSDDFYLGIGRRELTRQEVIEPLPDPDEQLLDILQFAPGHNPIADIREAMEGMPEHIPPARWVIKMK